VRPERIRLTQTPPDDTPNVFQGVIRESLYIGVDTRYVVELSPAISLRVRQQNSVPVGMPVLEGPSGVSVWVSWLPDSGRILME